MLDIKDIPEYNFIIVIPAIGENMKSQKCRDCTYYIDYYKQWISSFVRLANGYCSKHKKPQTQFKNCEEFKNNEQKEKRERSDC